MARVLEIPLIPGSQTFAVVLNGVDYHVQVIWRDAPDMDGGYVMDISDVENNPLIQGIPLVTGADLLAQYEYVDIGGKLYVQTDYDLNAVPTYDNLGQLAHLYYVTPEA